MNEAEQAAGSGVTPGEQTPARPVAPRWHRRVRRVAQVVATGMGLLALTLGARYAAAHATLDPATTGRELVPILLAVLLFVISLAVVLFRPEREEIPRLVATAAVWSAALLVAQGIAWYLMDNARGDANVVGTPLLSEAEVETFLADRLDPAVADAVGGRFFVPTGMLVQSVEFLGPEQVQVTGYVWQVYAPTVPADLPRGFGLPEAVSGDAVGEEIGRLVENGNELIGWHFSVNLLQPFDYRRYPFDHQDVSLRLWHVTADPRVVLVPDSTRYEHLAPATLPGVADRFVASGWEPITAGFSYADTSAGIGGGIALRPPDVPDLYFNVGLKRNFLGPYFDQITFAIVVALLLFAVLCLTARDESTKSKLGISTFGVLGTCSGLLFAVILKHNELRRAIAPDQIAYLEIMPSLLNLMIVLVALNAILIASPLEPRWLSYKNNLLPDLLFWPIFLGLLLTATVGTFYQ